MHRRTVAALVTALVGSVGLAGCVRDPAPEEWEPEAVAPTGDSREAWAVHEDLSETFVVTVYPTHVRAGDGEGAALSLDHRVVVENVGREELRDVTATLVLDALDPYLMWGATSFPMTGVDLAPVGTRPADADAVGLDAGWDQMLRPLAELEADGLDPAAVLELAEDVTLRLRWAGGEESLRYTAPVLDPDGLLGR